jgi:hypothetical protein
VDDLLRACLTVGSALHALRCGTPPVALIAKLDQASATIRDLPSGPFTSALRSVLDEIDHCRRCSQPTSTRLDTAIRSLTETIAK